jgi:hypothetical protein
MHGVRSRLGGSKDRIQSGRLTPCTSLVPAMLRHGGRLRCPAACSTSCRRPPSLSLPSRPANRSGSWSASICARQPRGQQPCRFVRGPSVEWHERASGSGDPHDVGSPAVWRNRRNLDEIRPSRDGFFEAMNDVGHQSRCGIILQLRASFSSVTRRISSEATHEGAAIDVTDGILWCVG